MSRTKSLLSYFVVFCLAAVAMLTTFFMVIHFNTVELSQNNSGFDSVQISYESVTTQPDSYLC